ncbi:hypothetical protein J3B02_005170, partial [Coemansia erecta]
MAGNKADATKMLQNTKAPSSSTVYTSSLANIISSGANNARSEQSTAPMAQSTMDLVARLLTDPSLLEKALAAKEFLQKRELVGPDFGAHLNSAAVSQITAQPVAAASQGVAVSLPSASSSTAQSEIKTSGRDSKLTASVSTSTVTSMQKKALDEPISSATLQRQRSSLSNGTYGDATTEMPKDIATLLALAPKAEKTFEKQQPHFETAAESSAMPAFAFEPLISP